LPPSYFEKKCDENIRRDLQNHFNVIMKPCPVFLANISFFVNFSFPALSGRALFGCFRDYLCISVKFGQNKAVFASLFKNLRLQIFFCAIVIQTETSVIFVYIQHYVYYYCRFLFFILHFTKLFDFSRG